MKALHLPQTVYLKDYVPPAWLVDQIGLEFDLNDEVTTVRARLHCRANPAFTDKREGCVLMGERLETVAVRLDGKLLPESAYTIENNTLTLHAVGEAFLLETEVLIYPHKNTALSGLYQSGGNYCTQCEAEGFRRITWFPDRPDVMAGFTTKIIADESRYPVLLSNGNLTEKGQLPGGRHWVKWEDPFRKPSYLFALVAGEFDCLEDQFVRASGRSVTLQIYVTKGNLEKTHAAMGALKKAMRWDEEQYGREYDLDIFMIVAVSDFNMGAMENKGLNIFNTRYVLASPDTATDHDYIQIESVIAHEYFHNWTGNRITCRDWFQLSLKEGLTVFRDQCFTADTTSQAVARIDDVDDLRNMQFEEDAGPLAHPVRPDAYMEINNFYTATVYNKGAEVIRMIRTLIGSQLFRKGMDLYFSRHDGEAVTIEDFVRAHEDASGMDLAQFRLWYAQAGTPVLEVEDHYDETAQKYTLRMRQSCPPTPGQPDKKPFVIPIQTGLIDENGKEWASQLLILKESEQEFHFKKIPERPVPSLLRYFSAPVRLQYHCSDDALCVLFRHDTDLFNRREAGFQYVTRCLLRMIREKAVPVELLAVFQEVFQSLQQEPLLLARMLQLPPEKYLGEQMVMIDVEGIHEAREYLRREMAAFLQHDLQTAWHKFSQSDHPGERALKNICLEYLATLNDKTILKEILLPQFHAALGNNMTDTMAALHALLSMPGKSASKALGAFYDMWQHDSLVIDKWFALQAGSSLPDTLERVKTLMQHPAWDVTNPNRVYALLGTLGRNMPVFHAIEGAGYKLLADCVIQLDQFNPHVAARMLKPLTNWQRHTITRQQLMCAELARIVENNAHSPDVYELVTKSLQAGVMA